MAAVLRANQIIKSKRQPPNLKHMLTSAKFEEESHRAEITVNNAVEDQIAESATTLSLGIITPSNVEKHLTSDQTCLAKHRTLSSYYSVGNVVKNILERLEIHYAIA